jgi:hypothetical protein
MRLSTSFDFLATVMDACYTSEKCIETFTKQLILVMIQMRDPCAPCGFISAFHVLQ